jgi:hypothetical protein
VIELIRGALRGQRFVAAGEALAVERSLPAGHVEAALLMGRRLELGRLLDRRPSRERAPFLAMIVQRLLGPGSDLAMSRALSTAASPTIRRPHNNVTVSIEARGRSSLAKNGFLRGRHAEQRTT